MILPFLTPKIVKNVSAGAGVVVMTNGCFDLLTANHVEMLREAGRMGFLFVGVNDDRSFARVKGRFPINPLKARMAAIDGVQGVDVVTPMFGDTPHALLQTIQPDILIKGGDYDSVEQIVGHELVRNWGGIAMLARRSSFMSTSQILNRIKENYESQDDVR